MSVIALQNERFEAANPNDNETFYRAVLGSIEKFSASQVAIRLSAHLVLEKFINFQTILLWGYTSHHQFFS